MTDKIKLLALANQKISNDDAYVSFYLTKYSEIENISQDAIISRLNCTTEDYFKLGLCKAPHPTSDQFIEVLSKISSYTNISMLILNGIMKRVCAVESFSEAQEAQLLMAARDKHSK